MNIKNFYAVVTYEVRDHYTNDGEEPKIIGLYASTLKLDKRNGTYAF